MSTYLFIDGDYLCGNFAKQMQRFYGSVPPIAFDTVKGKAERAFYYDAIDYNKTENETQAECDMRVAEREALHATSTVFQGFTSATGEFESRPRSVDVSRRVSTSCIPSGRSSRWRARDHGVVAKYCCISRRTNLHPGFTWSAATNSQSQATCSST